MADSDLATRLEDLEVRFAFQEDQIRQLDEVIQEQADHIARLEKALGALREQYGELSGDEAPPEEQVPPHY
jgi:SlyX protein